MQTEYLCLAIGNSRLHWAYFQDCCLKYVWDSLHYSQVDDRAPHTRSASKTSGSLLDCLFPSNIPKNLPLYIASVVPQQTEIWQKYPQTKIITLSDLPLQNLYPTLGIDRALAILGAGIKYGFPCLVIDGGTALTFTGVDENRNLVGGAILAGLKLQFTALAKNTAALPKVSLSPEFPNCWATDTEGAIISGILHTIIAGIEYFIEDWRSKYPQSQVIITGGDGAIIINYLAPKIKLVLDENIIFWGMQSLIEI
jgi:type III pantothenate kinase